MLSIASCVAQVYSNLKTMGVECMINDLKQVEMQHEAVDKVCDDVAPDKS